jgi:uncharacterized protein (TIGR03437 family)
LSVAVGDFNGDSKPDLIVGTWAGFYILLGAGGGNFGRPVLFAVEPPAKPLPADFNGDGKLDLALGGRVLLGRGDGTFSAPVETGRAVWIATGDFNGDRKADLVLSDPGAGTLTILLSNGDGTFRTAQRFEVQANQPHVADFNRDGWSDLAVVPGIEGAQQLSIFLGQGDGTFRPAIRTQVNAWGILPGDFNGDGLPDLATTSAVLLGKGDGTFERPLVYPRPGNQVTQDTDPFPYAAADFDGDGKLDLVTTYFGAAIVNHFSLFRGKGDGTLLPSVEYVAGWAPETATVADVDGDGRPDLIVTNFRSNTVSLMMTRSQSGPALRRAVSAASATTIVAPESVATLYAPTPAAVAEQAGATPWPTRLGGISLEVRDSAGAARLAPLIYVSPTQINFQVPVGTAPGESTLAIASTPVGGMQVDALAPGLFMASYPNVTPAATAVRVQSDGGQTPLPVFRCSGPTTAGFMCGPAPIALSGEEPVYLTFYGTGFRGATTANVTCSINGVRVPVLYAGPQGTPGLDQINVRVWPELRASTMPLFIGFVTLSIDGIVANSAWLQLR